MVEHDADGKRRILMLTLGPYPPGEFWHEIAIKEITDRVLATNVEYHLLTLHHGKHDTGAEWVGNVFVHRVSIAGGDRYVDGGNKRCRFKLSAVISLYRHIRKLQRQYKYDAWWSVRACTALPIAFARIFGSQVPYALTLDNDAITSPLFTSWRGRPLCTLMQQAITGATVIHATDQHVADIIKKHGGDMVATVPFGRPLHGFLDSADDGNLAEVRAKLGMKEGETWLVTTSKLAETSGIQDAIKALTLLPTDVRLAVVGGGSYKKALVKEAEKANVRERVVFVGEVQNEDVPTYLRACDIFVRAAREEGETRSYIDAMVCAMPVVATQEGGIREVLFDERRNPEKGTTGWAVQPDEPHDIARAIKDILSRPEQVVRVLENARTLIEARSDWDTIAKEVYAKVIVRLLRA